MTRTFRFHNVYGLAIALLALASTGRAIGGQYSIDILITPYHPGFVDSWLFDINNQGQASGYIITQPGAFTRKAIVYNDGNTQVWGSGPGTIRAINNHGDAVGDFNSEPKFFANDGTEFPIEVSGNFVSLSIGGFPGINDLGQVLINAFPNDPADTPPNAFSGLALWNLGGSARLTGLDPLYPYVNPPNPDDFNSGPSSSTYTSSTTRLNNANQFAAAIHEGDFDPVDPDNFDDDVFNDFFTQAYIYDGHGGYKLLTPAALGDEIRPVDVDDAGVVLGWSGSQLALWAPSGALQLILPLPGEPLSQSGYGDYPSVQRNDLGQIVGVTVSGGVQLYDPTLNAWSDITPSINGLGTGAFNTIQGFNDRGQFVGLVRPPQGGGVFGYLVSPIPEPSSTAICVVGLIFGAATRQFKARPQQ